jgi:hypothetical protein
MKELLVGLALALAILLTFQSTALAEEFNCTGALGAVTVDNLRVPQNATCTLNGTQVEGTIKVERNATLFATTVSVNGNVQAENAARVEVLPGSTVGGSIQIVQSGAAVIESTRINGDLYFDENNRFLNAASNQIGGNLQAFQNSGGLSITDNTIDGNLQCKENIPAPTGGGNTVKGNREDQCANLQPGQDEIRETRYGRVQSMPDSGLLGQWIIDGVAYLVDDKTSFVHLYGNFRIDGCVKVEYVSGTPRPARKMSTESDYKCGDDDDDDDGAFPEGKLYGKINSLPGGGIGVWNIGGLAFRVNAQTELDDSKAAFAPGVLVEVKFYTNAENVHVATRIEAKYRDDDDDDDDDDGDDLGDTRDGHAYGVIGNIPNGGVGLWTIGGIDYLVREFTELDDDDDTKLGVGVKVKVEYYVRSDQQRVAKEIEASDDEGAPTQSDHFKSYGFVDQMPASGFTGQWILGGVIFVTDPSTLFDDARALLAVGAYVEVEYRLVDGVNRVKKLESHVPPGAGADDDLGRIEAIERTATRSGSGTSSTVWVIGDQRYTVITATSLNGRQSELAVGNFAAVNSYVDDNGNRIATQVRGVAFDHTIHLPSVVR